MKPSQGIKEKSCMSLLLIPVIFLLNAIEDNALYFLFEFQEQAMPVLTPIFVTQKGQFY